MAIDTQEKRLSLIGYGLPWRITLPYPDGGLDQGDRQHLLGLYAGILASSLTTGGERVWCAIAGAGHSPGMVAGGSHNTGMVSGAGHSPGSVAGGAC